MSYVKLLHLMHKRLITKPNVEKKYIIRFKNKKEYTSCITNIKKLLPKLAKLSAIQPIHTLNAICCSLHSIQSLMKHKGILFIEEDLKIKYHLAYTGSGGPGRPHRLGRASGRAGRAGRPSGVGRASEIGRLSGGRKSNRLERRSSRLGRSRDLGRSNGIGRSGDLGRSNGHNGATNFGGLSSLDVSGSSHGPSIPWGIKQINAPLAWRKSTGKRVKIGIIDTGIDFTHSDLRSSIAGGVNFVRRFYPALDDNGHGTHIAGSIAAGHDLLKRLQEEGSTSQSTHLRQAASRGKLGSKYKGDTTHETNVANGTEGVSGPGGIMGVAPKASIYAIKAFDKNGSAFVSDIILGIDWCVRNKIDIINMSFGMKNKSVSLRDTIKVAYDAGLIIVASSGNEGKQHSIDFPARFAQTIAVGATNKTRQIASFSNRGKGINIYAPGDQIYSAWSNNKYNLVSGTSMATSHVTGVIALMLSLNPKLTTNRVKALLKRTATPIKGKSHVGEVSALKAVQACISRG